MAAQKTSRKATPKPKESGTDALEVPIVRNKALVFVSHDSRDADLAEAFGNLLTDASGGILKSFRSSDRKGTAGIEFGAEWYTAIMTSLEDATDVVALLTPSSLDRPWILYEAGVAKGKLNTTVFGVALGLALEQVAVGPFAQFQNCGDDEDSLTKLVLQLIRRNPDAAPRDEAVRRQVQAFRENIGSIKPHKTSPSRSNPKADDTGVAKLFEEVKIMFASLPEKLEQRIRDSMPRKGLSRRRGFHPSMLQEFLFHPALGHNPNGAATGWLLFLSAIREDLPWLYDLGIDLYRALLTADQMTIATARRNLNEALQAMTQSGTLHHFLVDEDPATYAFIRHLPELVDHFLARLVFDEPKRKHRSPKHKVTKSGGS